MNNKEVRDQGFEKHKREQIRAIKSESTPEQRMAWLEKALALAQQTGALARLQKQKLRDKYKEWNSAN